MNRGSSILNLDEVALKEVNAHEGAGRILFHRLFHQERFETPCHFVDYAVLPPGASIGVHQHQDNEEIYLVLEGEGVMHLDGQEHRVRAGSVIVNRTFGTHGLVNDRDRPLRLFVVEIGRTRGAGH